MIEIDRWSKFLIVFLLLLTLLSVAATYYDALVLRNYEVVDDIDAEEDSDELIIYYGN